MELLGSGNGGLRISSIQVFHFLFIALDPGSFYGGRGFDSQRIGRDAAPSSQGDHGSGIGSGDGCFSGECPLIQGDGASVHGEIARLSLVATH